MKPPKEPEAPPRPIEEAEASIRSLSDADLRRLEGMARSLMRGFRWLGQTDHEDLIQETLVKTLTGDRTWPSNVALQRHFFMVMWSIRSNWIKSNRQEGIAEGEQKNATGDLEDTAPLVELLESLGPSPERITLGREELKRIRALFSADTIESQILECWALELTGQETCERLGITAKTYDSARKRMWRELQRHRGESQ